MGASSLQQIQARVERHFDKLAAERSGAGLPLFALEHGLSRPEVNELAVALRRSIVFGGRLAEHWLLWVVYATELGYDFDGDEYWQSYEARTPQWTEDPYRRQSLRQFFERFKSRFGSAAPTGPWARQFSIIAWPITHAVLPKDLQSHMARALFELRHEIAEAAGNSPQALGRLIARRVDWTSSRFRNFLEQEELAGRIAKALLFPDEDVGEVLTPATFSRIVSDLEASWESRSWLKEARHVANQVRIRLQFKRAGDVINGRPAGSREDREVAEARCVAPRLYLRRRIDSCWEAFIELPSFAGWARANQEVDNLVRRSRCRVRGTEDTWRARRWLLFGAQQLRVLELPANRTSWLRFEEPGDAIVREIDDECRVKPRPWLFKVDDDGRAYQTSWTSVRPASRYIVVHDGDIETNAFLAPLALDVRGAAALIFDVPAHATEASTRYLKQLGLSAVRNLNVWPAGLPPLAPVAGDVLEWSSHLPLMIGVEHDETCDSFSVSLDNKESTFKTEGRKFSYVSLGRPGPGVHQVSVAVRYRSANSALTLKTEGTQRSFTLVVRTPMDEQPGRRHGPVMVVTADPPNASMDAMMRGLATCSVHGPKGRLADFRLELMSGSGEVIHTEPLGSLEMPVDQTAWKKLIKTRDSADSVGEAYFRASSGRLVVDGRDLGVVQVPLTHSISPVRWLVTRAARQVQLTLVDDTDHTESVRTYHASFVQPTKPCQPWDEAKADSLCINDGGGLYVATVNGHRSSVVVNVPPVRMSFDAFKHTVPTLKPHLSSGQEVAELLLWMRDWSDARLVGPLAEHQRNLVLREMSRQLYATLCGIAWANSELAFKDSPRTAGDREALEVMVCKSRPSFAIGLARHADEVINESINESIQHLLDHVGPYSICSDRRMCEIALRIGMAPQRFIDWAGSEASERIDSIVEEKILLKAVRLLALTLGSRGALLANEW